MGKTSPKPPPAPNPSDLIKEQGTANTNTAIASALMSMMGQNSPYGSVSYNQTGTTNVGGQQIPQYTQNIVLSPEQQALLAAQQQVQQSALGAANSAINNVADVAGKPVSFMGAPRLAVGPRAMPIAPAGDIQKSLNYGDLPALPGVNDFSADAQKVQDAMMARFNQDWSRQQENDISRLNASGNQLGTEAYGTQMDINNRARNDAMTQAILAGGQEQSRLFDLASRARGQLANERQQQGAFVNTAQGQQYGQNANTSSQIFGQNLSSAALTNQARQQAVNEILMARAQPINEVSQLLGLGGNIQMPQAPQFNANVAPTNVLGAYDLQQQALNNAYNQQMGVQNAQWGALGNLFGTVGAAALMKSDARIKNIHARIGETRGGIPIYLFSYKSGGPKMFGVVAQDVEKVAPDAVVTIGGVKHVDYARVP